MTRPDPPADEDALLENLRLELRRGGLVLAVLGQLRTEHYGYTLRKALAERDLAGRRRHALPAAAAAGEPGPPVERMARGRQAPEAVLPPLPRRAPRVRQLVAEWRGLNASIARILEDE